MSQDQGWTRVASVSEVKPGDVLGVELEGEPVVVADVDGELLAIGGICSHEYVLLNDGWLEGEEIECSAHGSRFNMRTGRPSGLPATQPVPVYEVKAEGNDVMLRQKAEGHDG